tara:strand:+ start:192 stop:374 length:183 start_codon:yes stop_codon:yes gene_type:complete
MSNQSDKDLIAESKFFQNQCDKLNDVIDYLSTQIKHYKNLINDKDDYIKRLEGTIEELTK